MNMKSMHTSFMNYDLHGLIINPSILKYMMFRKNKLVHFELLTACPNEMYLKNGGQPASQSMHVLNQVLQHSVDQAMAHYFAAVSIQSKHGDTGHHGIATKWRALLMIQDEEDKMREEQKKKE